ncbi:MAG TPA: ATP-binding protein [Roseiarcus sp.]|nr:ATP-binding protein [Roseiarcus sp.]
MSSLRRAVLIWTTVLLAAIGAVAFAVSYKIGRQQASEFLDGQLRQIALNAGGSVGEAFTPSVDQDEEDRLVVDVWSVPDGRLVTSFGGLLPQLARPGLGTIQAGGESWRVFLARDPRRIVQVGQKMVVRDEIAATAGLEAGLPILIAIPLGWLVLSFALGRVLRPLTVLAKAIAARKADSTEPIPLDHAPSELRPVLIAMNDLTTRLGRMVLRQRRFVSDAAHELRTPLTALRIQIDNLAAETAGADPETFEEMKRGLDRASALVGQMLNLARLDASEAVRQDERVDLTELVSACVAESLPLADAKGVDLGLDARQTGALLASREDLKLLVANLLQNAIRYTGPEGGVDVRVLVEKGLATIEILDTGPGIPEAELPRVFERFYRAAPSDVEGSGLGLAIAQSVARKYGFELTLANRSDRSGLCARARISTARLDLLTLP